MKFVRKLEISLDATWYAMRILVIPRVNYLPCDRMISEEGQRRHWQITTNHKIIITPTLATFMSASTAGRDHLKSPRLPPSFFIYFTFIFPNSVPVLLVRVHRRFSQGRLNRGL